MKHPLHERYWLNLWLETVCWALGHQWKHSPTRQTEWYDVDDYDKKAPYVLRKRSGNILFEDVAWWSAKCTRCRFKVRPDHGDPHEVWHRRVWVGLRAGLQSAAWHVGFVREDRFHRPWWVNALCMLMVPAHGLAQFTLHLLRFDGGGVPHTWLAWTWDVEHWWYGVLDRHDRRERNTLSEYGPADHDHPDHDWLHCAVCAETKKISEAGPESPRREDRE